MNRSEISRRDLLKSAAALPFAGFAAGARASEKVLSQNPRTGQGAFQYEVLHDWLTPPDNIKWGDTHGLAQDSQGRIYVAHTVHPSSVSTDAVVVFDQEGKFIKSWGSEFKGGAHGLDIRREGREEFLYHCDTARRLVVKTTLDGKVVWQVGAPTEPGVYQKPEQWCPTNVAFGPNYEVYVGDGYGSSYIHKYDRHGGYLGLIARPGKEKGQVNCPHGLWVDTRDGTPKLAVCDRSNNRIQNLTLEGKHIDFVTEGMRAPCHLKFNGDLALVPDLSSVVTILDKSNKPVAHLGDGHPTNLRGVPRSQFIPGKFVHPHTAIWLGKRDILVAEWVPIGRVTRLRWLE
ncbi:MAG TPA: hypothetical protein PLX06_01180 [Fimbriimonadaceae bacterium]|nr:hypothetical protein [Fimbriimonadaceae bacterium]